jgi:hypothetical protein
MRVESCRGTEGGAGRTESEEPDEVGFFLFRFLLEIVCIALEGDKQCTGKAARFITTEAALAAWGLLT